MKKSLIVIPLLILVLLPIVVQADLVDDRYHFSDYEDSPNVDDYGEWWYFSFYQEDIQGVVQYSLWDPAGLTEDSYGLMYVSVFLQDSVIDIYFPVPWEYIVTSETSADLVMGPNTMEVIDGEYQLDGYVEDIYGGTDNTIGWTLRYVQGSFSLYGFRNFRVFPLDPNEEMNWYVQMPSATVQGIITVNGEPISICAGGYHDHNWGVWELYHGLWNWFQTNEPGLAIVGYDFYTMLKGEIKILLDGEEITFKHYQYEVTNYDWTFMPEAFAFYPKKTLITACNLKYSLVLKITVQQTGLVGRIYDEPPVAWTVFESTALFEGKLRKFGRVVKEIDTFGFREYTIDVLIPPI